MGHRAQLVPNVFQLLDPGVDVGGIEPQREAGNQGVTEPLMGGQAESGDRARGRVPQQFDRFVQRRLVARHEQLDRALYQDGLPVVVRLVGQDERRGRCVVDRQAAV